MKCHAVGYKLSELSVTGKISQVALKFLLPKLCLLLDCFRCFSCGETKRLDVSRQTCRSPKEGWKKGELCGGGDGGN